MAYKDVKTYADFVKFFNLNLVLNNDVITLIDDFECLQGELYSYCDENGEELTEEEYYTKFDAGENVYKEREEIFQYYIIGDGEAEILQKYTDEIVFYSEKADMYLWGIDQWGTPWEYAPITLKELN